MFKIKYNFNSLYYLAAMRINEELKKFIQGINGMGLGTRDKDLSP